MFLRMQLLYQLVNLRQFLTLQLHPFDLYHHQNHLNHQVLHLHQFLQCHLNLSLPFLLLSLCSSCIITILTFMTFLTCSTSSSSCSYLTFLTFFSYLSFLTFLSVPFLHLSDLYHLSDLLMQQMM